MHRALATGVLLALAVGCSDDASPAPSDSFIAVGRDFRGFADWPVRVAVDGSALPIDVVPGPTFVYAQEPPPTEGRRFPIGTMLVKAVEVGAPTEWTIHAMVKRSGDYNAEGSVGWEFFGLRLDPGEMPVIEWRGEGPPSGLGYALPGGGGADAGVVQLTCNDCHSGVWMTDSVLTPDLAPAGAR